MKKSSVAAKRLLPGKAANPVGKVIIRKMPSGVHGLDDILGGGIPEFSFNIIAGAPGCGKTTLAHQILFANATAKKPALYFTVLGEPAMKMLRYQQQYSFFDESKLGKVIRFINLADVVMEKDLNAVFEEIARQVAEVGPSLVVVDSFRTVVRKALTGASELEMQNFIQRLAQFLTSWEATTFLVGEYVPEEVRDNPVFTVADGLIWLSQVAERNSVVRKLQIMKLRGQASVPGLHTIRISEEGLQAFSRTLGLVGKKTLPARRRRLSMGIPELDKMLGGGVLEGDSLLTFTAMTFSHYAISFLTDDIIRLRYVEIDGQLRKVLVVVKMRGGNHSKDIREYVITDKGVVVIGPRQTEYARLTSGLPERIGRQEERAPEPKAMR